jgi:general secretion pathway protein K
MRNNPQSGMAILMVLLITAMMSALMVTMNDNWRKSFQRSEFITFQQQARWLLLGAEALVIHKLNGDNTSLASMVGKPQSLKLDQQTIHFLLQDRQNCFNINALMAVKNADNESEKRPQKVAQIFRQLLMWQGMEQQSIDSLQQTLSTTAPLVDISQLRVLPEINRAQYHRLAPLFCVQPQQRLLINLNALTPQQAPLLAALFTGYLTPTQAAEIIANRPDSGWRKIEELTPLPPESQEALIGLQKFVSFSSDRFELELWMTEQQQRYQLNEQLRLQKAHFSITRRQYGSGY